MTEATEIEVRTAIAKPFMLTTGGRYFLDGEPVMLATVFEWYADKVSDPIRRLRPL